MVKIGDEFNIGEICQVSGVYRLKSCTCVSKKQETIPLAKGNKFPPCKNCVGKVTWELIEKA